MNQFVSYTMRIFLCVITSLLFTHVCQAQHIYQINADSVRIYNNCDTAELILENHTQDTLGFLINKGKGRTEFRRLQLGIPSPGFLSIPGQDTVNLGFANFGDTRYDLLSTNFFTIPQDSSWIWSRWPSSKVVGYDAYKSPDMPALSNQAFKGMGENLYYNGIVVRDGSSGFDMAVNWDGELNGPNGVFVRTKDDTQQAWSAWRELVFKDYADTAYKSAGGGGTVNLPRHISTNTTLDGTYSTVLCDNTGIMYVYLPPAAAYPGHIYTIRRYGVDPGQAVVIWPASGELIDGALRLNLTFANDAYTLQSDGTKWTALSYGHSRDRFILNEPSGQVSGSFHIDGDASMASITSNGPMVSNGPITAQGAVNMASVTVNRNTTLDETYYTVLADIGSNITITLPDASECRGRIYVIKKISNNTNTITLASTSGLIEDAATQTITGYKQCATLQSNGTNWYLISAVGFTGW
ncbi:hypothetical protein [Chitinophaga sp. GbtcB8]|uniref:hypothetical protein n=1 Tax=Chitinophaga sp. GbtcB8 TaxID=2824753 RepID=UPI0020C72938|nr:hypothetical protein [Chitinophaga sp. GbtcB8]